MLTVYVEAAAGETEMRLHERVAQTLSGAARRTSACWKRWRRCAGGRAFQPGKKILIVLDQFEQWLHAKKQEENTELVQALRQCDGGRVQCIVMVRDDFWMAATRFMRELEVPLVEGHNSAAVDLFDTAHARKVLTAFGRAFGKVSGKAGRNRQGEKEFFESGGGRPGAGRTRWSRCGWPCSRK